MAYYYFKVDGEASTLDIDTEAIEVILPSPSRSWEKVDLANNSAYIRGDGSFIASEISFVKRFKKVDSSTATHAWHSLRAAVMRWLSVSRYKTLYFYIVDGDGNTLRARVVPSAASGESYRSLNISNDMTMTFIMVDGYFERTTATTTTKLLISTTLETQVVTNNGVIAAPPTLTLTLTDTCDLFQVQLGEDYGFRLEYTSWVSGDVLSYNCRNNTLTVNGNIETGLLTAGSPFNLEPGDNTLYIYGAPGSLDISINERYL